MANNIIGLSISETDDPAGAWFDLSQMYSSYTTQNNLTYVKSPSRTNDLTLNNSETAKYVPTVTFTFNYISTEEYRKLIQLINSKGFFVKYYDYELGMNVQRRMYCSEQSISNLYNHQLDLVGLLGVKITFVSVFGYDYYYAPVTGETDANWTAENCYHYYNLKLNAIETRVQEQGTQGGEE